jgi:hypothetical protein
MLESPIALDMEAHLKQRVIWVAAVLLLAAVKPPGVRALAQAPGYAEIISPGGGETLQGLIPIEGSADHPAFLRYDLAFAYDPNPTDTWFPLGEPISTRARQATLGLWDTSELASGVYQLRLRVFLDGGAILEDTAAGLRVGLPAVAPLASGPAPAATSTPAPGPTATPPPPQAEPPSAGDPVLLALGIGGFMAAAFLVLLAAYLPLRRGLSVWAGNLRMRRLLRQDLRRRRERGDRGGR